MIKHELKTDAEVFDAVVSGKKTYEIRYNDRNFVVGDVLILRKTLYTGQEMREGKPLVYVDDAIERSVSHVLKGPIYGLSDGWVILSIAIPSTHCVVPKALMDA